jgi:hypothetical protein
MNTTFTMNSRTILMGFLLVTGLILAVALVSLVRKGNGTASDSGIRSQPAVGVPTIEQAQDAQVDAATQVSARHFSTWEYSTVRLTSGGNLRTNIYYKHDSISDLKNYAAANKELLPEVIKHGGRPEIAVTLAMPMSADDFRKWAKQYAVQVAQAQVAVGAPGGSGGTLMIGGSADDTLPEQSLAKFPFSGMDGVFGFYGTVDAKQLPALAADPHVFVADVTPAWVRLDLARQGVADALSHSDVRVTLAFGWMEALGLVPTPAPLPSPVGTASATQPPIAP